MRGDRRSYCKRLYVLLLVSIMAVTYMPMLAVPVYAGGGTDLDGIVHGLKGDGSVDVGMTLTVSMEELDARYGGAFLPVHSAGDANVNWYITDEEYGEDVNKAGTYSGGVFSYTIQADDAGKWIMFCTDSDDSTYNNNTKAYKINKNESTPDTGTIETLKVKFGGTNGDGTIDIGSEITADFAKICDDNPWVMTQYNQDKIAFVYRASETADFSAAKDLDTVVSAGIISTKVSLEEAGLYIRLYTIEKEAGGTNSKSDSAVKVESVINVNSGPSFGSAYRGKSTYGRQFTFEVNGWMECETQKAHNAITIKEKIVRLYRNGSLVGEERTGDYNGKVIFNDIDVSYDTKDSFKAQIFVKLGGSEVSGPVFNFEDQADQMSKNKVVATKLSSKKALLKWSGSSGASGYYIYKGSKKIAEVAAAKRSFTVSKSGAGKAKYKVVPFVKSGASIYTGKSGTAKPKTNAVKFKRSISPKSYSYCTCLFVVTKVELKGRTYIVTGYAVNNRIFKMNKYSKLSISMTADGKKAFSKTYKNLKVGVGASKSKKMTLKIKGKAGRDLANGSVYLTVTEKPKWPYPAL